MRDTPGPVINPIECKACGRCVASCPRAALILGDAHNERGYRYVRYVGTDCAGCGNCYYTCPEPGAIELRLAADRDPQEG